MDYVTVRELRERSGQIWQRVAEGEEIVVTRNGKPFALLLHTEPTQVEAALRAHRAARLGTLVAAMRQTAKRAGSASMSDAQIDAEVAAARLAAN